MGRNDYDINKANHNSYPQANSVLERIHQTIGNITYIPRTRNGPR